MAMFVRMIRKARSSTINSDAGRIISTADNSPIVRSKKGGYEQFFGQRRYQRFGKQHPRLLSRRATTLALLIACILLVLLRLRRIKQEGEHYSCLYREYPDPEHHQGLPFLAEVFASDGGKSVYFVALNKGGCLQEWKGAQEFHSTGGGDGVAVQRRHTFVCGFPDGSLVTSDPVQEKLPNDEDWSNAVIVIRCDIPDSLQFLVKEPSSTTRLTGDLYGTEDVESFRTKLPISRRTSFQRIPVCHGEWPSYDGSVVKATTKNTNMKTKRYLSMMTKIKMRYFPHEGEETLVTIDPAMIVSWIEYNRMIGFEHFYLYDNEPEPHGLLEELLLPYILRDLVTYVHYPMEDCIVDHDTKEKVKGDRFTTSQAVASSAALRRYSHLTTYMAHFDIDEYIFLPQGYSDIKHIISGENESFGFLSFELTWYHECDDLESSAPQQLSMDRSFCYQADSTPWKSIFKTNRILAFFVHTGTATVDGSLATNYRFLENVTVAHYRSRRKRDPDNAEHSVNDPFKKIREEMHMEVLSYMSRLPESVARESQWYQHQKYEKRRLRTKASLLLRQWGQFYSSLFRWTLCLGFALQCPGSCGLYYKSIDWGVGIG